MQIGGTGVANYSLSLQADIDPLVQKIDSMSVAIGGMTLSNVLYRQNLSSYDYCNLTYLSTALDFNGVVVDYRFLDHNRLNVLLPHKVGLPTGPRRVFQWGVVDASRSLWSAVKYERFNAGDAG